MSTELSSLIQQQLNVYGDQAIWVIEENSQALQLETFARQHCTAHKISNRVDLATSYDAHFSDFDISPLLLETPDTEKHLIFRIAKEKSVNLHIIQTCMQQLRLGSFTLYGFKNEGIKSLLKLIKTYIEDVDGLSLVQSKYGKQLSSLCITSQRQTIVAQEGDNTENNYAQLQTLEIDHYKFISKPGQFGWKKIDLGSRLLIEQFDKYQKKHGADTSQTLLDLGCGYGFLSIAAKQLGFNTIDATDNCAAALLSCEENFKQLSINGAVISSDCGDNISKHYDMILCNPPFHHGFDHDTSLTEKFVERSAKLLKKGGKAFFVVNEFVGIEKEANKHFTKQLLLDKNSGFKIIMLSH